MERLKGETGASPVLTRNCNFGNPAERARPPAQQAFTTLSRKGGGEHWTGNTANSDLSPPCPQPAGRFYWVSQRRCQEKYPFPETRWRCRQRNPQPKTHSI